MWTVQAPHCATPHPNLVPVSLRSSRSAQRSGVSGSTSTSRKLPFTRNVTMAGTPLGRARPLEAGIVRPPWAPAVGLRNDRAAPQRAPAWDLRIRVPIARHECRFLGSRGCGAPRRTEQRREVVAEQVADALASLTSSFLFAMGAVRGYEQDTPVIRPTRSTSLVEPCRR